MDSSELEREKNRDVMKLAVSALHQHLGVIAKGGGKKNTEKIKSQGKLTARERIARLTDEGAWFLETGALAGHQMYDEEGGCPAGGVVAGIGRVSGRQCVIVANDMTVKAGAWFPITVKKNLRMQEIAMENRLPVIYLVDSAGIYLPLQDEVFADRDHFGRVFYNNARMSAMGITQIAAVMGSCVAGGAYLPVMSDETLMVEGAGSIFLAGPYLVRAAIGEQVDIQTLGGAETHNAISGVADYRCASDEECLDKVRDIMSRLGAPQDAGFDRVAPEPPAKDPREIYALLPADRSRPYDMREIIGRITDRSEFVQFKEEYGATVLCGYARIDGWAVGIVANQRLVCRTKGGEMRMGGVIYNDSADKAARFVMNCNQKKIPLVFLQDVTGFMVGSRSEHAGIIKDGAKLVNAVSNSVVPKITVIIGNSYGAGNYAMCGKAYDPRFIFGWPSARIAVMGGEQAARTLLQIQVSSLKKQGREIAEKEEKKLLDEITGRYEKQTTPYYAAARLWLDAIIDPLDTRRTISGCIEAASHAPVTERFNPGLIQV
jgi:acetyl-CoA carboxylase carboxyltransferase component